ncbi:AMP-binding protein [Spirillospora sp. NPDC127200]
MPSQWFNPALCGPRHSARCRGAAGPLYTEDEMRHQLTDCGARVAVVLDRSYATVAAARGRLEHVIVTSLADELPRHRRAALRLPTARARRLRAAMAAEVPDDPWLVPFEEMRRPPRRRVRQHGLIPSEHLAAIQYTGGTEGRPKGAMLTHRDLDSVRVFISGAMAMPPSTAERLEALGGHRLTQCYGLTEASPAVTANPLTGDARNTTVGVPLPLTDVVVVDRDEPTRVLPPGAAGELVVRGPQVFAGYWNQPLATARALSKGWLRTADIGVLSADGFVTVVDRHDDMVKVSGFSVSPSEVEEVLRRHPAVLDCAVVGAPDRRRLRTGARTPS